MYHITIITSVHTMTFCLYANIHGTGDRLITYSLNAYINSWQYIFMHDGHERYQYITLPWHSRTPNLGKLTGDVGWGIFLSLLVLHHLFCFVGFLGGIVHLFRENKANICELLINVKWILVSRLRATYFRELQELVTFAIKDAYLLSYSYIHRPYGRLQDDYKRLHNCY